jgi:hypothetical protein
MAYFEIVLEGYLLSLVPLNNFKTDAYVVTGLYKTNAYVVTGLYKTNAYVVTCLATKFQFKESSFKYF